MDFRQYDNALGRFNVIDPLAEQDFSRSVYCFAGNNPVLYGDPSGLKAVAPQSIENNMVAGSILSLLAHGMSGQDLSDYLFAQMWGSGGGGGSGGSGGSGEGSTIGLVNSLINLLNNSNYDGVNWNSNTGLITGFNLDATTQQQRDPLIRADGTRIKNADIDGDGKVSLIELDYWYRNANGEEIFIKASSLSMNGVDPALFKGLKIGDKIGINLLFTDFWGGEGSLYGELEFEYRGGNQVHITPNKYDFDTGGDNHPWFDSFKGFVRNVGTVLGNIVAGSGTPFMINFTGNATLNYNPNP